MIKSLCKTKISNLSKCFGGVDTGTSYVKAKNEYLTNIDDLLHPIIVFI
jgi:hypothetical protein